jgi:flagellar hook-associated protein 2
MSSSISPLTTLTGSSTFASDLQAAVNRALTIAALPQQLLQADQNRVNSQVSELSRLGSLFSNLQNSVQSLTSAASGGALATSVSDTSVLQASLTGEALPGTYTVQVLDAGSSASAVSIPLASPVTDPSGQSISQSDSFTLTVDGTTYTIQPPAQSLNSLATAINASGAPVQAVVINLGSPSTPDYHLVIQSTTLGAVAIQLNDGSSDLLSTLSAGSNASYTVNGQPPGGISTNTPTVTIAPGLDVTLAKQGTASITVSTSLSSVSNALSSLVNTYNTAEAEIQQNRGQNAGALNGDSIVLSLQQALSQIFKYTGSSGSITNLTQLGITYNKDGTLSYDPTVVSGLSATQISDALSFLGNTSSGFLQVATDTLNTFTDPNKGIIASETQALQAQNQRDQDQISAVQARLDRLQENLLAQMAKADALIATLQQQNTFLQGLFQYATSNNPNAGTTG